MKKYTYLAAVLFTALFTFGCGRSENPAQNSNAAGTNVNSATRTGGSDTDDARPVDSNRSVDGNLRSVEKKDADDLRSGNTNRDRLDRDDPNKMSGTRDNRKHDEDRDSDDN